MNMRQLCDAYMTDEDSNFLKLRYVTREGYRRNMAIIIETFGAADLADLGPRDLLRFHAGWAEGGRISQAHGLVSQLRIVVGFGATILQDDACKRLREALSGLRFQNAKPRVTHIDAEQAKSVRDEAITANWLAIALAQAFQFDCALRQKDVIGEWVPADDPEPSTIFSPDGQMKWVRGITREEVGDDMVLTHKMSKRGKVLSFPLKSCPSVMQEWYSAPPSGPLIIDPQTDLPFEAWKYRRIWRELATKAGVPKNVWNMDTRAGRITQLLANGVSLEDARKFAGHSQATTTVRYSRGSDDAIVRALDQISDT